MLKYLAIKSTSTYELCFTTFHIYPIYYVNELCCILVTYRQWGWVLCMIKVVYITFLDCTRHNNTRFFFLTKIQGA